MLKTVPTTETRMLTATKLGSVICILGHPQAWPGKQYARFSTVDPMKLVDDEMIAIDFECVQMMLEKRQSVSKIISYLDTTGWDVCDHRPTFDEQPSLPEAAARYNGNGVTWVEPRDVKV